ncbi:MAG: LysM peptidoglycan-binding domain-containing protein [Candidatus Zambryskibacteria bacterium]|nr:LysM peptidoglycan-binding domain-containing protein [Candidatus Zambryskibacteria bacterium]
MKERGRVALLSHFVILGLVVPLLASAKPLVLIPESKESGNSQTMNLLEGYLNTNPTSIGGAFVTIIDDTALSAEGDDGSTFVDPGKSGTGAISVYVVRQGDTLGEIAEMFGVSVNTIRWANDLKSNTLKVGQELVILPISGVRHTVKSGDTLESVAKKYKADLDDILSYNNIPASAKLAVGDVIIIPDGVMSSTQTSIASQTSNNQTVASGYYLRPISGGRKSQGLHGRNGVDLAAPVSTPILASAAGKVIISRIGGWNGGYGTYVVISHSNGTQTLYAHMSINRVAVSQYVDQGEVIGAIGLTGKTTGPHLHFEIRGARNPF